MESDFMRMQREATEQLRRMSAKALPLSQGEEKREKTNKKDLENTKQNEVFDNDTLILLLLLFLLYTDGGDSVLMLTLLYLLM